MSTMKEIQKKDEKTLVAYVQEKREEVRSFRFGTTGASTRNVRAIRTAKKEIARSLYELGARRKAQAKENLA